MKADGCFYIDGDKKYPRVTSVLERWYDPSAAAATWVAQECTRLAQLARNGEKARIVESVWTGSRFEWAAKDVDPVDLLHDQKWLVGAYWRGKQGAMDRGSITNEFIDEWADGMRIVPDDAPDWVEGKFAEGKLMPGASVPTPWKADRQDVLEHVCSAIKFLSECEPDIRATQVQVKSESPLYAGTADALGGMGGKPRLFEFKTGQPNRSHALQVAGGYAPPLQKTVGKLVPTIVYLTKDRYRIVEVTGKYRTWCRAQFLRDLKAFEFSKRDTPWDNVKSVPMTEPDYPFIGLKEI